MKRPSLLLGAALLLLLAAMALKGHLLALPEVRSEAKQGQFDTQRAMERLSRILGDQRPHPVDSQANDLVRARLVAELRALGLQPRISDHFSCNGRNRGMSCARVRNVTATIGPAAGRYVLVVSHYDSVPVGPGAADDGIGVATMLETAAVLSRKQLRRPVTFLFNEGEETGLLGARAFLKHDPIAARVDSLVNLEARGVTGPALMFETSLPNGPAVAALAGAARPSANSLSTDFYRMIPNSTDVAIFDERAWTILNFAIIGNETRYHSPGDRLEALDQRSLQHMGDQALHAVLSLNAGSPQISGPHIFADLLGRKLVILPVWGGLAILGVLTLFFAGASWRRRPGIGRSMAAIAGALAGSAALAFLAQSIVALLRAGEFWRAHPWAISLAIDLAALMACLAALAWIARPIPVDRLRRSFWLLFLLLGAALSAMAVGAVIFFLLPPLVAAIGIAAARWRPGAERIAGIAAVLLLFLTLAPILHLMETLLDFDSGWIFAPVAALILMPAVIEMRPLLAPNGWRPVLLACIALLLAGWTTVALVPAYSDDRKQKFGIEYVWNSKTKRAQWMIANDGAPLPEAIARAVPFKSGVKVPWSGRRRWAAPAEGALPVASTLQRLGETRSGQARRIRLGIAAHGAEDIAIQAPPEAGIRGFRAGAWQRRFTQGRSEEGYALRCRGRSCDGLVIEIVAGKKPVPLTIIGTRYGLPASARPLVEARPANAAPQYMPDATISIDRLKL